MDRGGGRGGGRMIDGKVWQVERETERKAGLKKRRL